MYATQKDEINTIELLVKLFIERNSFYGKNNNLEIFTLFFTGISNNHVRANRIQINLRLNKSSSIENF